MLVKADASKTGAQSKAAQQKSSDGSATAAGKSLEKKLTAAAAIPTVNITLTTEFKCSGADLYAALTDEGRVAAWTRRKPSVHPHAGGTFTLMEGQVSGRFESVVPGETLVQKWRLKQWPEGKSFCNFYWRIILIALNGRALFDGYVGFHGGFGFD